VSFSIEVDEQVAKRLREIPVELVGSIVEQVDRLGENPRLGVRISSGVLEGRMLYAFVVEANPRVFRFAVLYLLTCDEQSLYITELGMLRGDGKTLHLAENWPPP